MTSIMRVTQQSASMLMVANLQGSLANLTNLQEEAATGLAINQASDNPTGTSQVLALNAQLGRFNQYSSNISDGQAWLNTADSALGSAVTALNQVQTAVLNGANASASDTTSDQALSAQVLSIKQELLGLAATSYNNRYIFSGTYGTTPYPQGSAAGVSDPTSPNYDAATAYSYAGSTTAVSRMVAPGEQVKVSLTADQVFGSGSNSVFALLDTISQDLASGNSTALSGTDLTSLKSYMEQVTQSEGDAGALGAAMTSNQTRVGNTITQLQDQVATISDANEATVATNLDMAEASYQAALDTTAKIIQPSLVSFLS